MHCEPRKLTATPDVNCSMPPDLAPSFTTAVKIMMKHGYQGTYPGEYGTKLEAPKIRRRNYL